VEAARRWDDAELLNEHSFGEAAAYFRNRYYGNGAFTYHYAQLKLRRNDEPILVAKFLKGESDQLWETAAATLIIVYRFRNNLFHGEKWAYDLHDQRANFLQANSVLMHATTLDRHARARRQ
jgi:hypothetical protein